MCIEKVRYQSFIVCHISIEFKDNFNWNLKTELMNIIIQLLNIMFCGGRNSYASQIGRVTMCPGFFCLSVFSHPGLPYLSYAGPFGVRYSIRHLPVSAKLWCS